jgi:acylphosphatase
MSDSPDRPTRVGRRCVVSGRVQGVHYRFSAQQQAQRLGVVGHACNLADGTVEVLVYGDERAVLEFIQWLWQGPAAAKVTDVTVEVIEPEGLARARGFRMS